MTGEGPGRRRRARWLWVAGSVVVAVVLFVAYLRLSRTYAATSDGADQALQGWDMLHGNVLLHGWTMGDVTYYTTEVPEYALVELFRGLRADVVHIAGAATYTLLVLAAGLLARGRATGREGLVRLAGGVRDHAHAPVRERHPPAAVAAGSPGHPAAAAARVPPAGPRAAALVRPGRGRRGAHLGRHRRPGGPAHRGRAARAGLRCPCPAGGTSPAIRRRPQVAGLPVVRAVPGRGQCRVVRRGHARRAADRRPARVPGHPGEVGDAGIGAPPSASPSG